STTAKPTTSFKSLKPLIATSSPSDLLGNNRLLLLRHRRRRRSSSSTNLPFNCKFNLSIHLPLRRRSRSISRLSNYKFQPSIQHRLRLRLILTESTTATTSTVLPPQTPAAINTTAAPSIPPNQTLYPPSFSDLMSNSNSTSSSTSTSSEAEIHGGRNKRKRKWKDLFERLLTEVVNKQEEMQRKFLEAIENRGKERISILSAAAMWEED
ncbi:Trihelix transcription factor GT-2, partial [Linum perenne]